MRSASAQDARAVALQADATAQSAWLALMQAGRLKDAYLAAEAEGFEVLCDTAEATDLLALADGARFAGRSDRARVALFRVRARFAATPPSALAAFRLGTIAQDQEHAYGQAAHWLRTCMQEQPAGTFAREAHGRLIEVERQLGNLNEARRLAQQYLQRWPDGPHAPLARSLAGD